MLLGGARSLSTMHRNGTLAQQQILKVLTKQCPHYGSRYLQLLSTLSTRRVDAISPLMPPKQSSALVSLPPSDPTRHPRKYKHKTDGPIRVAVSVSPANQGGQYQHSTYGSHSRFEMGQFWNLRVLVLSMLFETMSSLELHIITFREWGSLLENFMLELKQAMASVLETTFCFQIHAVDYDAIKKIPARMGINVPIGIFARVLLPLILSDINEIIYLDTDQFAVTDLRVLWDVFATMPASKAIVSLGSTDPAFNKAWGAVAGCQLIMRLESLRRLQPSASAVAAGYAGYEGVLYDAIRKEGVEGQSIAFFEQKMYGWLMQHHELSGGFLIQQWNYQMCSDGFENGLPDRFGAGFVHFNCMPTSSEYGKFASLSELERDQQEHQRASIRTPKTVAAHNSYSFAFSFYFELPLNCLHDDFGKQSGPPGLHLNSTVCRPDGVW